MNKPLYKYDTKILTEGIKKYIIEYYNGIIHHFPGNHNEHIYQVANRVETITRSDKTKQLRDVIIPYILDEIDDKQMEFIVDDINSKKVTIDNRNGHIELELETRRKSVSSDVLTIKTTPQMELNELLQIITCGIDNKIREELKDIKEIEVTHIGRLYREMLDNEIESTSEATLYSRDKLSNILYRDVIPFKFLNSREILLIPKNTPLLMSIRDVSLLQNMATNSVYSSSLEIIMSLVLIAEPENCILFKLADNIELN